MIDRERMVAEFCELVKIASPSRGERLAADAAKAKLTALGLEVLEDDVAANFGGNSGNVIGYLKGSAPAPVVMLSAHLDCVEPCVGIEPEVKDGVITSRGDTILGADDKAGVVGILEALRVIGEKNISHGDIQVIFTVAEETGLCGAKFIDKKLLRADFGYILDSGGTPGRIVNSAPGQDNVTVVIRGKAAHAGMAPEDGVNAIMVAGKAMARLNQGRIDAETTANVGIIKGGIATNIVPDQVEISCEARSRDLAKLAAQTKHMVETFTQAAAENGARAEISVETAYEPYVLAVDSPVITAAVKAAQSVGFAATLEATGGGSDANFFNKYGIPSAVLGVGMSKVHTTEEYVTVDDLERTARLVVSLVQTVAGMEKKA
ncbi:MAG: M20/M25/M40 family metallo-hydrolase [Negativicutes bacterium]|nr:M20/M25/M40 family metallo-hydrolase [Negativicutes bacterium]